MDANGTSEATLWRPTGAAHGLGFFPGGNFSWILGSNGLGDYTDIASLSPTDPFPHVFVAHAGGPLLALPLLSGDYSTNPSIARGIDRQGDVAGASNKRKRRRTRHALASRIRPSLPASAGRSDLATDP